MSDSIPTLTDSGKEPRREDAPDVQWALPYETASADDRVAHMASAHHLLFDSATLHAQMHAQWAAPIPHEHLTPTEALFLTHAAASPGPDGEAR